jgi:hypothetical protein
VTNALIPVDPILNGTDQIEARLSREAWQQRIGVAHQEKYQQEIG